MLLGFGTGIYGVLVGAGGGFILGPMLLIFFDMEPETVAGTALALVAINSISGAFTYRRMGIIDWRSGLLFTAAGIPGSVLGPFAIFAVTGGMFRILFGVLLLALAAFLAFRSGVSQESEQHVKTPVGAMVRSREVTSDTGQVYHYQFNEALATSFNFVLGFISSFFGTGGGFLRTPILVFTFGFPVRVAVATSIFTLSFIATTGALTHAALGHVDWFPTFVWAGIGLVVGGQIGARLAGKIRGVWIIRLLLLLVLILGIRLIFEGIAG